MLVFGTELPHLASSNIRFMDGTFDVARLLFTQLYLIRVSSTGCHWTATWVARWTTIQAYAVSQISAADEVAEFVYCPSWWYQVDSWYVEGYWTLCAMDIVEFLNVILWYIFINKFENDKYCQMWGLVPMGLCLSEVMSEWGYVPWSFVLWGYIWEGFCPFTFSNLWQSVDVWQQRTRQQQSSLQSIPANASTRLRFSCSRVYYKTTYTRTHIYTRIHTYTHVHTTCRDTKSRYTELKAPAQTFLYT